MFIVKFRMKQKKCKDYLLGEFTHSIFEPRKQQLEKISRCKDPSNFSYSEGRQCQCRRLPWLAVYIRSFSELAGSPFVNRNKRFSP